MKTLRILTIILTPALMLWAAWADDPFGIADEGEAEKVAAGDPMIAILVEWIQLDHRTANGLVRKHVTTDINADDLRSELEGMLDDGTAQLIETAYLVSIPGVRTKSESIGELIYPTEFDPAEIPQTIDTSGPIKSFPTSPANPTAFDVRNVGTSVEVEANIGVDDETIAMQIAPEIVTFLGSSFIGNTEPPHELLAAVKQPDFYVMKSTASLATKSGHHALLNVFKPHGEEDKRVLLMIRASVIR